MDSAQFAILDKKIDVLIGLLTIQLTKGQTLQDRVELLFSLGLKPAQIAKVLGKSVENIAKAIVRIKKRRIKND